MPGEHTYDYAIIRVVPRVERGELINVGVILSCPSADFLEARIEVDAARMLALDPTHDVEATRAHLEMIPRVCRGGAEAGEIGALPPHAKAEAGKNAAAAAVARGEINPVTLAGIARAAAAAEDVSSYAYVPGKPFAGYAADTAQRVAAGRLLVLRKGATRVFEHAFDQRLRIVPGRHGGQRPTERRTNFNKLDR